MVSWLLSKLKRKQGLQCLYAGHWNPPYATFCRICGNRLKRDPSVPPTSGTIVDVEMPIPPVDAHRMLVADKNQQLSELRQLVAQSKAELAKVEAKKVERDLEKHGEILFSPIVDEARRVFILPDGTELQAHELHMFGMSESTLFPYSAFVKKDDHGNERRTDGR